jgi:hypothetical protein
VNTNVAAQHTDTNAPAPFRAYRVRVAP